MQSLHETMLCSSYPTQASSKQFHYTPMQCLHEAEICNANPLLGCLCDSLTTHNSTAYTMPQLNFSKPSHIDSIPLPCGTQRGYAFTEMFFSKPILRKSPQSFLFLCTANQSMNLLFHCRYEQNHSTAKLSKQCHRPVKHLIAFAWTIYTKPMQC